MLRQLYLKYEIGGNNFNYFPESLTSIYNRKLCPAVGEGEEAGASGPSLLFAERYHSQQPKINTKQRHHDTDKLFHDLLCPPYVLAQCL